MQVYKFSLGFREHLISNLTESHPFTVLIRIIQPHCTDTRVIKQEYMLLCPINQLSGKYRVISRNKAISPACYYSTWSMQCNCRYEFGSPDHNCDIPVYRRVPSCQCSTVLLHISDNYVILYM